MFRALGIPEDSASAVTREGASDDSLGGEDLASELASDMRVPQPAPNLQVAGIEAMFDPTREVQDDGITRGVIMTPARVS